jgi:hypothetical protein
MTEVLTVPALLARAHGVACEGPHACFYCGAPCDGSLGVREFVKDSFTGRPGVVAPGSPWVCAGCVLALRESADVTLIDGTVRPGQMMRTYSWVLTATEARAATKAHLARLRALCLDPPAPPFALVLSDSGQTHQLYRGVVDHDRAAVVVTLEGERVGYRPADLAALLGVAGRLCAATGKPALKDELTYRHHMSILTHHGEAEGERLGAEWAARGASPLGRLAAWLCPPKEECLHEYPAIAVGTPLDRGPGRRGVPPEAGGPGGPAAPRGRRGERPDPGGGEGPRQPLLFDPR